MDSSRFENTPVTLEHDLSAQIAIIDKNNLLRSCLERCMSEYENNSIAVGYSSVEEWKRATLKGAKLIVLLCTTGRKSTEAAIQGDLEFVLKAAPEARVIVISDFEESTAIAAALKSGARGYIAMSSKLEVAMAAIDLVDAGGTFAPASALLPSRSTCSLGVRQAKTDSSKNQQNILTERQLEVIDRLRQGESNKLIAYNLNMEEHTVKAHVRSIMQKIRARNRTEIVFLTNNLF